MSNLKRIEVWLKVKLGADGDLKVMHAYNGKPSKSSYGATIEENERFIVFHLEADASIFANDIHTGLTLKVDSDNSALMGPLRASLKSIADDLAS